MSSTNAYRDSQAEDYLKDVREFLAKQKALKTSATDSTLTYVLPIVSTAALATPVPTATTAVLGTYDVTDNVGSLIAYLPFDLTCNDVINTGRSAANDNSGTVTGTETYVTGPEISSTHKLRKAFSFNGSSYVTLNNENNMDFEYTNTFSVSLWMKSSTTGTTMILISKENTTATAGWRITKTSANAVNIVLHNGTTAYSATSTSTTLCNSVWHHIVGTYAGTSNQSGLKIYVDGTLETTGASSAISVSILNAIPVVIGAMGNGTSFFTGSVSHVQIWNKELTQADVTRLYAGKQINRDTGATNAAYIGISDIS